MLMLKSISRRNCQSVMVNKKQFKCLELCILNSISLLLLLKKVQLVSQLFLFRIWNYQLVDKGYHICRNSKRLQNKNYQQLYKDSKIVRLCLVRVSLGSPDIGYLRKDGMCNQVALDPVKNRLVTNTFLLRTNEGWSTR